MTDAHLFMRDDASVSWDVSKQVIRSDVIDACLRASWLTYSTWAPGVTVAAASYLLVSHCLPEWLITVFSLPPADLLHTASFLHR